MKPVIDMPAGVAAWIEVVTEYARLNQNISASGDMTATIGEVFECLQELNRQHEIGNSAACRQWLQENSLLFLNWIPSSPEQLGIDTNKTLGDQVTDVFFRGLEELCQDVE